MKSLIGLSGRAEPLESIKSRHEAGDKSALFDALVRCAQRDLPMPEWVSKAILRADNQKTAVALTDWREVFGEILPRKAQRQKKRASAIADALGGFIMDAAAESTRAGSAPDWDAIAKKVSDAYWRMYGERPKLTGGTAKDVYYRTRRFLEREIGAEMTADLAGNPKRGRPKAR